MYTVQIFCVPTVQNGNLGSTQWFELRLDLHCFLLPQKAATIVRATRYKCLHKNIAGKHCQQCFQSNRPVPGDPDRHQMPSAIFFFFLHFR